MPFGGQLLRANDAFTDWASFIPTFANFTVGNGTTAGRWRRMGNFTIQWRVSFLMGSTSAVTGLLGVTIPGSLSGEAATLTQAMVALAFDNSVATGFVGVGKLQGGGGVSFDRFYGPNTTAWSGTVPMTWAVNDFLVMQGWTEVTT